MGEVREVMQCDHAHNEPFKGELVCLVSQIINCSRNGMENVDMQHCKSMWNTLLSR